MKLKRIILIVLGTLIITLLIGGIIGVQTFNNFFFKENPNYLSISTDYQPIRFAWKEVEVDDYIIEKAFMLIPAKIEGVPHKFYFQFDTGHSSTVIYGNTLASLKSAGLAFNTIKENEKHFIEELSFKLGGSQVNFRMLEIHGDHGEVIDVNNTSKQVVIGSIGSDFMSEHITEIDFKNMIIQLYDKRQDWMTRSHTFQSFDFTGKKLMLPCVIDNKKHTMYFDTGCSSFGLMTTKGQYENYANPKTKEISYELASWGKADRWNVSVQVHQNSSNKTMMMAGANIGLNRVAYVDLLAPFQELIKPFTKIDGWLGNMPFLEHSLIFDAPRQEFVIIKK
jgi:hypothetical protein